MNKGKFQRPCVRKTWWLLCFSVQIVLWILFDLRLVPHTRYLMKYFLLVEENWSGFRKASVFKNFTSTHAHTQSTTESCLYIPSPRLPGLSLGILWLGVRSESGFQESQKQLAVSDERQTQASNSKMEASPPHTPGHPSLLDPPEHCRSPGASVTPGESPLFSQVQWWLHCLF